MALSQEEITLNEERLELVNQIDALKALAKEKKKAMDAAAFKRQTLSKLGAMSDEERAALKEFL
jgi:hypothetical protein